MSSGVTILLEERDLWIALVIGIVLAAWALRPRARSIGSRYRSRYRGTAWQKASPLMPTAVSDARPVVDSADQLTAVMSARFTQQRVLSKSEARICEVAERAIADAGKPWRVMAQVSLGEVLRTTDPRAFAAVNSKRVDLLIVDGEFSPLAAIEYQGGGHYQGKAAARDAVKKEALRRAGVGYIEMTSGSHGPSDLRREIERLAGTASRRVA